MLRLTHLKNTFFSLLLTAISFSVWASDSVDQPIPHGEIAKASGAGALQAWFSCPTTRYRHAVLGDNIEGGCLLVKDETGVLIRYELEERYVFEDVTPRLADIDGDNRNDVIAVRSDVNLGAALVVYSVKNGQLQELAATPPIGRSFRWLAPAGIADFNRDGQNDIAYVETPHLGGLLRLWTFNDGGLKEITSLRGFSNHSIGASRVSLSRVLDHDNDGAPDLALPSFNGQSIEIVSVSQGPTLSITVIDSLPFDPSFFD